MLSNTTKYAIRAMIYLAIHQTEGGIIGIRRISEDLDLPAPFLAKILQTLTRHKLLTSYKGPNGGFSIGMDPSKISLFDIITIIEGQDLFDKCLISMRSCNQDALPCSIHHQFVNVRAELMRLFMHQDLKSLAMDISNQERIFAL